MQLRRLEDLDLTNKRVFLRLDLNVPIKDGVITDDTRIRAALPTIRHITEQTNKVCICSHLGRPKGEPNPKYSLEPVGSRLAELLEREVVFVKDYDQAPAEYILNQLTANQFMLLENLRFFPGETKNDLAFSRLLASGFDYYVNDAFGTAHRAHASVVGAAECLQPDERAAGFLIQKEIDALGGLLKDPKAPFTVIMGGAKVSDKISVILNLLSRCNNLIIGGAMAYTFLRYQGLKVGSSRVEEDKLDLVKTIYANAEQRRIKILLPQDHVGAREFSENAMPLALDSAEIPDGVMGLDIGPKTAETYSDLIRRSHTVLWNGPMGVFEWESFATGTNSLAAAVAACPGYSVVGGGDSVAAVNAAGVADKIGHISTGGGASLEFLEGKILPGLRVLATR